MKTASRRGSSTEPVRIEIPPELCQRLVPEEGWLQPKSQNNMIRRVCMGERLDSIEAIVERYCVASSPAKSKVYIGLGILLIIFAAIGIWVPGWPTVSWAVPAAFLFSMSSESMFKWTLTNRFFGATMFEYYATGKTIPKHAKLSVMGLIALMTSHLQHSFGMFQPWVMGNSPTLVRGMVPTPDMVRLRFSWSE